MMRIRTCMAILVLAGLVLPAAAADVYVAQYRGDLYACDLDGSNPSTLATGGTARYWDLDVSGNYIFTALCSWGAPDGIYRYDLDGSNATLLVDGQAIREGGVDVTANSVYYITPGTSGELRKMDFDGSNNTLVYTMGTGGLAVFVGGSFPVVTDSAIYWVADSRRVQTCALDGTGAAQLFDAGSGAGVSSLCTDGTYLYYALDATGTIYRRNLDGTNETTLATGLSGVQSLQVANDQLYWADASRNVYSVALTGGTPSQVFSFDTVFNSGSTWQIYIDVTATAAANAAPIADAGADQLVADVDADGETVTLDGSASIDSDGTIASYVWTEDATQIATGVNPQVSLATGTHVITLTVTDDDGATDSDEVTVNVQLPKTVTLSVNESVDDTYSYSTGHVVAATIAYWPYRNTSRLPFARFKSTIPAGATVVSANLKLCSQGAGSGSVSTARLQAVDMDDCPDFTTNPFAYAVTATAVDWDLPASWTADQWYSSPDISDIVQEFLDRTGYEFGNYLGLRGLWINGPTKVAYQWDYDDHTKGPQLEVAYVGGEAMVELLMADPEVRLGQKIYCRTYNVNDNDVLEARLDGNLIFSCPGDEVEPEEMFTTDYTGLTAGTHTLAVRVIAADQTVRGENIRTWTTLHDGIPHVGINVNNAICIDGTPFLPVTSWMFNTGRFDDPLSTTINTLRAIGWYPEFNLTNWIDYLDSAEAEGWYVEGPIRWEGHESHVIDSDEDSVIDYVLASRNHDAMLCWFWHDEPDLQSDNAPGMRWLHELTRQYDTEHPTGTILVGYNVTHNDGTWANNRIKEYCYLYNAEYFNGERTFVADIIGIDYYVHEYSTYHDFCNLSDYLLALDRIQEWNYNLAPLATYVQPCDEAAPDNAVRLNGRVWTPPPNAAQVKNLTWLSLIHGAKSLSYFHFFEWFTTSPRPNHAVMEESLIWIEDLTQVILSAPEDVTATVTSTIPSGYRVDHMTRQSGDTLYIFTGEVRDWDDDPIYFWPDPNDPTTAYFNIPQGSFTGRFDVSGLAAGTTITVYGENRTITSQAGYFEDTFDVHDVHIYVIEDE